MDVFKLREWLISDYSRFITSFIQIKDARIKELVDRKLQDNCHKMFSIDSLRIYAHRSIN